jgi:hypothetical protein
MNNLARMTENVLNTRNNDIRDCTEEMMVRVGKHCSIRS